MAALDDIYTNATNSGVASYWLNIVLGGCSPPIAEEEICLEKQE